MEECTALKTQTCGEVEAGGVRTLPFKRERGRLLELNVSFPIMCLD